MTKLKFNKHNEIDVQIKTQVFYYYEERISMFFQKTIHIFLKIACNILTITNLQINIVVEPRLGLSRIYCSRGQQMIKYDGNNHCIRLQKI